MTHAAAPAPYAIVPFVTMRLAIAICAAVLRPTFGLVTLVFFRQGGMR